MSMSTHVVGIKPPDEKWKRMKRVADACNAAGTSWPREVDEFFDGEDPDPAGVIVELDGSDAVRPWSGEMCQGAEIDVSKLPADVTIVRFFNSW